MTVRPEDVYTQLRACREDLTRLQGRVTDIVNMLNTLALPERELERCPHCGLGFQGPLSLAEHVYNSHKGPLPEHYIAAEKRAGLDPLEGNPLFEDIAA